MLYTY